MLSSMEKASPTFFTLHTQLKMEPIPPEETTLLLREQMELSQMEPIQHSNVLQALPEF